MSKIGASDSTVVKPPLGTLKVILSEKAAAKAEAIRAKYKDKLEPKQDSLQLLEKAIEKPINSSGPRYY